MKLLIGCPVRRRDWILPLWFEHVYAALPQDVEYNFCFITDPDDHKTVDICFHHSNPGSTIQFISEPHREDVRSWTKDRKAHMVWLRNILLDRVRKIKPDFFLSLDSDILLNPEAISAMLELQSETNAIAVGGKTYMSWGDTYHVSAGMWKDHRMSAWRRVSSGTHPVDIIMAIKLMTPEAYNINYEYHKHGEDLGWCKALQQQTKHKPWFCGSVTNKHVMKPEFLNVVDKRVGF